MVEGCIWKTTPTTYQLQLQFKNNSEFKEIDELLKDWRLVGCGTNKQGDILNIFCKEFPDPNNLNSFVKTLPVKLVEFDRDGNKRALKTAFSMKLKQNTNVLKSAKQGCRTCGKCGMTGHNSRTCRTQKEAKR